MAEYTLTPLAEADLEDIWDYIAKDSPDDASGFVNSLIDKFPLLASYPKMGRSRQYLRRDVRAFPVKKYIIFYRPIEDGVQVVRILRGSRNLEAILGEPE